MITFCVFTKVIAFQDDFPKKYTLIYELSDDWQVYDDKYKAYIPYIAERHKNPKTMSVWLDLEKYQGFNLIFYIQKDTYLFINKNLSQEYTKVEWISMSIDSLKKVHQQKKIFFTFYNAQLKLPLATLFIGLKQNNISEITKTTKSNIQTQLDRRLRQTTNKDFVVIIMVFLLIIYTFLWNYNPKTFLSYFSLRSSLSTLANKDSVVISKPLVGFNLLFLLSHAFLLGFVYILLQLNTGLKTNFNWINFNFTFLSLLFNFLFFFLMFLCFLVIKYGIIQFFGLLLNIEKNALQTHFFEFIRLSMLFYTSFVVIPIYVFISFDYLIDSYNLIFKYFILIFHLIQASFASFFVYKQVQYKNLYLFYYLCITELTPLLIGFKFLLF